MFSSLAKGVMTRKEKQSYESIAPVVNLFWVPATWFTAALHDAVSDGILTNESDTKLIMEVCNILFVRCEPFKCRIKF